MAPIGKEMLCGTYQQMAHKMWQHKILRMELVPPSCNCSRILRTMIYENGLHVKKV